MVVNLEAEFPEEQWNDLMIDTGSLAAQNFKERMGMFYCLQDNEISTNQR